MNEKIVIGDIKAEPGTKRWGFLDVAETATRMIRIPVVIIEGAKPGPTLGLLGGTHGLEYSSMEAVIRITKNVDPKELRGAVVAVTCVSEPVFEASGNWLECTAFLSKIDSLNQDMVYISKKEMAERREGNYTMSYRIADKLSTEVFPKLDYVIDCHGGDLPEDIGDFIIVSFTGNEKIDNGQRLMIECFNSEIIYVDEEERFSRSTTSFCSKELGIPTLMIEGGQGYNLHMERTVFHYNGIVNLMKRLKMIPGTPKITSLPKNVEDFASTTTRRYASCGGLLYHKIGLGMPVSPGQVVAEIENLFGKTVETIRCENREKGRVYKVRWKRVPFPVNAGDMVLIIAGVPGEYSKLFGTRAYTYWCTNCTKGY